MCVISIEMVGESVSTNDEIQGCGVLIKKTETCGTPVKKNCEPDTCPAWIL